MGWIYEIVFDITSSHSAFRTDFCASHRKGSTSTMDIEATLNICHFQGGKGNRAFASNRVHSHSIAFIRIQSLSIASIPTISVFACFVGQGLRIRAKGYRLTFNHKERKKTILTFSFIRVVRNQSFPPWSLLYRLMTELFWL